MKPPKPLPDLKTWPHPVRERVKQMRADGHVLVSERMSVARTGGSPDRAKLVYVLTFKDQGGMTSVIRFTAGASMAYLTKAIF